MGSYGKGEKLDYRNRRREENKWTIIPRKKTFEWTKRHLIVYSYVQSTSLLMDKNIIKINKNQKKEEA